MNRQTNVLRRISIGFATLIGISLLATVIGFGSWLYMNNKLQTQRDHQVKLATLTERVKGGYNIEIDSARAVLLERAFGSSQHTNVEAVAAPVDAAEAALQKILPDQASKTAFAAFEARHFAGVPAVDKDPAGYVREAEESFEPPASPAAPDGSLSIGSLKGR